MATTLAAILDRVTALCSGTTHNIYLILYLAYGNCARGTSGSQNRGVLSVFCEMQWVLVSGYGLEYYN